MNARFSAALTALLVFPASSPVIALDPNNPADRYCGIVGALGKTALSARDKGLSQDKARREMLEIAIVQREPQLQADVKEIVEFVYVTARDAPSDKLADFIMNDWCLNQMGR